MCRIAGILLSREEPAQTYGRVKDMCAYLEHGGPDDEGIYLNSDGTVCLGHRRLSILDLSQAGHQPMSTGDTGIWISFNGEIYNFQVLRLELETKGYHFTTHTDTEVILLAYQHWGVEAFARLKGMFAFCITDHNKKKAYLVRDVSGIKPLYFTLRNSSLIFASEVKAFEHSGHTLQRDPNWKIYLLAFGHIPEPFTTLAGVQNLPKGHYLEYDLTSGVDKLIQYHHFEYSESITDLNEAIMLTRECINQSVKRHLISDAPIGVFLSGGIDSSIVTLVANKYQRGRLNTLSINLEETDYTEKKYQELVIKNITGTHHEFFINYKEFIKNFDTITSAMDQPSADGINSWFVSKSAKDYGLKAVLSGLGGDELFGGYPSFQRMSAVSLMKKLPGAILKKATNHPNSKFQRLYYLGYDNPIGEYLFLRGFYTPPVIAAILDSDVKSIDRLLEDFPIDSMVSSLKGGNRASWFEMNMYMQNQLLKDTDYMSMRHGIEVRVPFLDQDLISLALQIHPDVKFNPLQQKTLLIQAFKEILPEPVWNRRKMGFSFPFQEWMRKFERISDPNLYANKMSKKLMEDFHKDKLHWSSAFMLYHVNKT